MDILFPPDLVPSTMMFGVDDFTAVDESATTGGMQSSALFGTRRWHLRMDFAVLSRANGKLSRFEALTAALRGRANRVWISPAGAAKLRGSFPAVEMFANNDFGSGLSSWSTDGIYALSPTDHGIRATRSNIGNAAPLFQGVPVSAGIPYAMRGFVNAGKGNQLISMVDFSLGAVTTVLSQGMMEGAFTRPSATPNVGFEDLGGFGIAGNFFDARWSSFSRCAQVDNGQNMLLNSDTPGSGTGWAANAATFATASAVGPDGAATVPSLVETTANTSHVFDQSVAVPSAAGDFSASFRVKASNRTWCYVEISNGVTGTLQWFNLSTGALGTLSVGANFTFISAQCVDYGNGWKRCVLTVRKTDASTALFPVIGAATADNVSSYVGTVATALLLQRSSFAQSSVPVAEVQTAGTAQAGTLQTGFSLNLKGLPVSTQGLLLEGDVVECLQPVNSQLLRVVVSRLDSDAAGLGTLIFENALKQSPNDGAGVVVQQPMGRFVLASSTLGIEYTPGVFGQASLEFVEAA